MRVIRTNFDREEARRDRRYALPALVVNMGGQEYTSENWSLGGFCLKTAFPLVPGALVVGTLHIDGSDGFEFTAKVTRNDKIDGVVAFHFRDMTPLAVTKLDRALGRRLVSRWR